MLDALCQTSQEARPPAQGLHRRSRDGQEGALDCQKDRRRCRQARLWRLARVFRRAGRRGWPRLWSIDRRRQGIQSAASGGVAPQDGWRRRRPLQHRHRCESLLAVRAACMGAGCMGKP